MQKRAYIKKGKPYVNTNRLEDLVRSFVTDAEKYFVDNHPGKSFGIKFCRSRSYTDEKKNWNITRLKDSEIHILEIMDLEVAKSTFKEIVGKYALKTSMPPDLTPEHKYLMLHL